MKITHHHPRATLDHWGYIPSWLNEANPKTAKEQLNDGYAFGGWQPFDGFTLAEDDSLVYPGDPPQKPISEIQFRDERVILYPSSWVAVVQPNRSFEVCRMD
jgi:hypothetical protein